MADTENLPLGMMEKQLANNLPESYGLLYVRDGDDAKRQNTFTVYRLARGKLDELVDGLLSPCVPTIEAELT